MKNCEIKKHGTSFSGGLDFDTNDLGFTLMVVGVGCAVSNCLVFPQVKHFFLLKIMYFFSRKNGKFSQKLRFCDKESFGWAGLAGRGKWATAFLHYCQLEIRFITDSW